MMSNQLRKALEDLRQHYIQRLEDAGIFEDYDEDYSSLTLSELKNMYKSYLN